MGTRDRMVDAAVDGLRRRGLAGMSFTDVLAASGAARGAIYHHFPDGKRQLVAEAAAVNGREVLALLEELPGETPAALVAAFLELARPVILAAAQGEGCPVAAVTVRVDEAADALCEVAAEAFASWERQLAVGLTRVGLETAKAAEVAALLVALLEGAQILCRAAGEPGPYDRAARAALCLV